MPRYPYEINGNVVWIVADSPEAADARADVLAEAPRDGSVSVGERAPAGPARGGTSRERFSRGESVGSILAGANARGPRTEGRAAGGMRSTSQEERGRGGRSARPFSEQAPVLNPTRRTPAVQVNGGRGVAGQAVQGVQQGVVSAHPGAMISDAIDGVSGLLTRGGRDLGLLDQEGSDRLGDSMRLARILMGRAQSAGGAGMTRNRDAPLMTSNEAYRGAGLDVAPQNAAEAIAGAVGRAVPGLALPGTIPQRVAQTAIPALASEGAGQVADAVTENPWVRGGARAAGGLAGGLVGAIPGRGTPSQRLVGRSLADLTEAETARVQALMQRAEQRGVRLTLDEAVEHITQGRTGIGGTRRAVEDLPEGRQALSPITSTRPQAVRRAGARVIDRVGRNTEPPQAGLAGRNAAEGALRRLESDRSNAVNPLYEAAGSQTVDPDAMRGILNDMAAEARADKTGLLGKELNTLMSRLLQEPESGAGPRTPILDVENLDRVRKFYRDRTELPPGSTDALPREVSGSVGQYLSRMLRELETVPEFAQGNQLYRDISQNTVNPAQAGPLGAIAKTDDVFQQGSALLPESPGQNQIPVTQRAIQGMGAEPSADILRQYLARMLAEKTSDLQAGPNQMGGANFARDVAGNPLQQENLMAALDEVAPGVAPEMAETLDVFRATGRRPGDGSRTAPSNLVHQGLAQPGTPATLTEGAMTGGLSLIRRARESWADFDRRQNAGGIADILTTDAENAPRAIRDAQRAGQDTYFARVLASLLRQQLAGEQPQQ